MLWFVVFWAALLFIIAGIFLVIGKKRFFSGHSLNVMLILGISVYLASAALAFPVYLEEDTLVYAFLKAVSHGIRMFVVDTAVSDITDGLDVIASSSLYAAYKMLVCLIYLIAPLFTLGIVAEYFGEVSALFRIRLFRNRRKYIFSQLNERSCILAESIADKNQKKGVHALYVFCNVDEEKAEDFDTLQRRVKRFGAVMLTRNEMELPFWKRHGSFSEDVYFEIGTDEDRNLQNAIHLIERAKECLDPDEQARTSIYVFSNKEEAEIVLDAVDKEELRVRLLDPEESAVYQLLFRYPLYRNLPEHASDIKVLILGCGRIGMEALKAVLWCGQMHSLGLKVYVADLEAERIERRLRHDCPELLASGLYHVEFKSCDVFGSDFDELLKNELQDVTYCILALKEDEENICAGIDLRRAFRRMHADYAPTIALRVKKQRTTGAVRTLKEKTNVPGQKDMNYELIPFGCEDEFYHSELLGTEGYEALALNIHLQYSSDRNGVLYGEDQDRAKAEAVRAYYSRQSNIRSSRANALHIRYKLWELGYDMEENGVGEEEGKQAFLEFMQLTEEKEVLHWLADVEHRRWMAFYYTEGWCRASLEQYRQYCTAFKNYDPLAKCHPCLIPSQELERLSQDIGDIFAEKTGGNYRPDYVGSDEKLIRFIPRILQDYWEMTGQKYWLKKRG